MWDERYSADDYVYGTEPNDFLAAQAARLPPRGRVLCLAEGEGRNAVFLAGLGHAVTAVDASAVGLAKAQRLAEARGVSIETCCADLADFDPGLECWDGIVSIFCHLPPDVRTRLHARLAPALRPGGVLLLEAYTPDQLALGTGGPARADMMMTPEGLADDFAALRILHLQALRRPVVEGRFHTGEGAVVQLVGVRD